MTAESDDMLLDQANWTLTVVKKDTFNVLSNKLNVQSSGFVYLGADETDAYPTGGNANLEQVTGNGEIRIKVSGSILNASTSGSPVIQGHKAILEAANGSIGTALKPVTMTLNGGGNLNNATLVARAQDGIWINQTGDIRIADAAAKFGAPIARLGFPMAPREAALVLREAGALTAREMLREKFARCTIHFRCGIQPDQRAIGPLGLVLGGGRHGRQHPLGACAPRGRPESENELTNHLWISRPVPRWETRPLPRRAGDADAR